MRFLVVLVLLVSGGPWLAGLARADLVPVRYTEGLVRGFLVLKSPEGKHLADGEVMQSEKDGRLTSRLTFRFKDGSYYEETNVYSQKETFRLLSDHVIQKGPSFKTPLESSIDATTGQVDVQYTDDKGKPKSISQKLEIPPDVCNGLLYVLLKDIDRDATTTLSYVAITPSPRVVKLVFTPQGSQSFVTGSTRHEARHFQMKVDIGGIAGVVAPVVGKKPADTDFWVFEGDAPSFLASEGPLYGDGPVWRIELVSPVWPRSSQAPTKTKTEPTTKAKESSK